MLGIVASPFSVFSYSYTLQRASDAKSTPFLNFFRSLSTVFLFSADICFPRKRIFFSLLFSPISVKSKKFAQKLQIGNIYSLQKSGKNVEACHLFLCKSKLDIHSPALLLTTLVDKLVDNVENSELSTGISLFSILCQKLSRSEYNYV